MNKNNHRDNYHRDDVEDGGILLYFFFDSCLMAANKTKTLHTLKRSS